MRLTSKTWVMYSDIPIPTLTPTPTPTPSTACHTTKSISINYQLFHNQEVYALKRYHEGCQGWEAWSCGCQEQCHPASVLKQLFKGWWWQGGKCRKAPVTVLLTANMTRSNKLPPLPFINCCSSHIFSKGNVNHANFQGILSQQQFLNDQQHHNSLTWHDQQAWLDLQQEWWKYVLGHRQLFHSPLLTHRGL